MNNSNNTSVASFFITTLFLTIITDSCFGSGQTQKQIPSQSDVFEKKLEYVIKEKAYLELLEKEVLPYLKQKKLKSPSCFISYAWGNENQKLWVEKFAEMLEKSGIKVILDRWEDKKGKVLNTFIKKIGTVDWTIVIGTNLYLQKSKKQSQEVNTRAPVVTSEMQLIEYFIGYNTQRNDKIVPILLEGTPEESLPLFLRPKLAVDFTRNEYFQELLKLVHDLYGLDNRDQTFLAFYRKLKEYWLLMDASITSAEKEQYQQKLEQKNLERKKRALIEVNNIKESILKEISENPLAWGFPRQDNKFIGRVEYSVFQSRNEPEAHTSKLTGFCS